MASQTSNLNLIKPALTDFADIADLNSNADTLDSVISSQLLSPSTAISIPSAGSSVTKTLNGITANHELIRWNFSSSAENDAPVSLTWSTSNQQTFTITNNAGSTSETIRPVFAVPVKKTVS